MVIASELQSRLPLFNAMTKNGQDFFMRALHPNDETRAGGVMIPDAVTIDRAVSESRLYGQITSTILKDSQPDATSWDCQILILPTIDNPIVYRIRKSGEPWDTTAAAEKSYQRWRVVIEKNGLAPGDLQIANGSTPFAIISPPQVLLNSTQFRQAFRGFTCVLDAPATADQGMVTAGQWGNKPKFEPLSAGPSAGEGVVSPTLSHMVFDDIPDELGDVIQHCPESGQWEARHGVYMPLRFEDPVHEFNGGAEDEFATGGDSYQRTGHPILVYTTNGPRDYTVNLIVRENDQGHATSSAGAINQAMGCVYFSGLDMRANLNFHTRTGVELVPVAGSITASYARKNAIEDETAIKAVTAVSSKLPVVYYHKYNSLGMLLPLIGQVANMVLPTVAPWIARTVGRGAQWISDRFTGRRPAYQEPDLD